MEPSPYESPAATSVGQPRANAFPMVCAAIVILGNLAIGSWLALIVWLMNHWMIDDSLAFCLTPAGWAAIAIRRTAWGLLVALAVGLVSGMANRSLFACLFPKRKRVHWLVAAAPGWMIALGSIAGSVQFLLQKPFM